MIADITLCRRFHVRRLDVFGSAARGDFDPARSDLDFLVEFAVEADDLARFVDFKEALETLLARRVDLVDRKAIEASPNYIRKRHILTGAEPVCARLTIRRELARCGASSRHHARCRGCPVLHRGSR